MTKKYSPSVHGFYDIGINSVIPDDAIDITDAEYDALFISQSEGKIIQPNEAGFPVAVDAPKPEVPKSDLKIVVQNFLDAKAKSLGYDSIATAVTYADEPAVPKFQKEGQALRAWRSLVWAKFYEILDVANTSEAPDPTPNELIKLLPELVIPA